MTSGARITARVEYHPALVVLAHALSDREAARYARFHLGRAQVGTQAAWDLLLLLAGRRQDDGETDDPVALVRRSAPGLIEILTHAAVVPYAVLSRWPIARVVRLLNPEAPSTAAAARDRLLYGAIQGATPVAPATPVTHNSGEAA